jgi:hypothetical protein
VEARHEVGGLVLHCIIPRNRCEFLLHFIPNVVADITKIIHEYEVCVRSMQNMLRFSHGRRMLGPDGGPNRLFFSNLFHDHVMAIKFLKEISLLQKVMQCDSCVL